MSREELKQQLLDIEDKVYALSMYHSVYCYTDEEYDAEVEELEQHKAMIHRRLMLS